jgi:hypothetical protein
MELEDAKVIIFKKSPHFRFHIFHIVVVGVPASGIDKISVDRSSKLKSTKVLFINCVSVVVGIPEPRQSIEDICFRRKYSGVVTVSKLPKT